MVTKAAFKAYRRDVLRPALVAIQEHFIAPIATLIVGYIGISTTREEHFMRLVNTKSIVCEQKLTFFETVETTFTVSQSRGAEFHLEYVDRETMLFQVTRHGDPHVQSIAGALAMFDVPLAFAHRIRVAGSWLRICDHYYGPCACTRGFFNNNADGIVQGLRNKYLSLATDFTRHDIIALGYNPMEGAVERYVTKSGYLRIPQVGAHKMVCVETSCMESYPCQHVVMFADNSKDCLDSVEIKQMFIDRGLEPSEHFIDAHPLVNLFGDD